MRLLLTTDTIGGIWTFTKELSLELLAEGHAVALISFGRAPSPAQLAWADALHTLHSSRFLYVPSLAPLEWMNDNHNARTAALPALLRLIDHFAPDLVHANQFCFGHLPLPIPTLITAHSDALTWAAACQPEGLRPSPWLTQYTALVRQGLAAARAVVAPTRWMLDELRCHLPFAAPGHVILNGRSLSPAPPEPRLLQAVSVGRLWDRAKNLALLTEVDTPLPILIAGDRTHEDERIPTLPPHLQMLGTLDESDLLALLRRSSFYLVPSLYEPFGLAPLEAALCGCAILAQDIPSLREVWGDAALYFRSAPELAALLNHLAQSEPDRLRAQQQATLRAAQLTAPRTAHAYQSLYRSLLASKSKLLHPSRVPSRVPHPKNPVSHPKSRVLHPRPAASPPGRAGPTTATPTAPLP